MKPPIRDNEPYAIIMVRRNPGRKGWKTLIRPVGALRDDAVHDQRTHAPHHACMR
ncbi:hypothetical protein [Burkholderia stagnalis]|uniref:hypothetical protein n=1 Tax=Burkholderia stagnalis TaxID=1503054 RepID=UPI000B1F25AC|nr:hypothetical protein [Burkholderia stagnalis]